MRKHNERGDSLVGHLLMFAGILAIFALFMSVGNVILQDLDKKTEKISKITFSDTTDVYEFIVEESQENPTFTGFGENPTQINIASLLNNEKYMELCGSWRSVENKKFYNFKSVNGCKLQVTGNWKKFSINNTDYVLSISGEYYPVLLK